MPVDHVDVLIIGAGLSGVAAACHLTRECPGRTYAILERRERMGGTWDLFRYPGVRSDSDMYTFGFTFRPWLDTKVLADGASIRRYLEQTAAEYRVDEHVRYGTRMVAAHWSTDAGCWSVETVDERSGAPGRCTADVLVCGTGYYDYDHGHRPHFPGEDHFTGTVVHPQQWPDDLDYTDKRVVVIGSGATAITLVPAMAPTAARVTMLQRSPGYIVSLPAVDLISAVLAKVLPTSVVYTLARVRNIAFQRVVYALAQARPATVRKFVRYMAARQLAGASDLRNFTPDYDPWDQRLCVVPDGDLFRVVREGRAEVVTDTIETFTETGIALSSGRHLDADIVVTATGLQVQMLGGATLTVDDEPVVLRDRVTYKGVLLEDVPNAAIIFGYTNASWTLKADLACEYMCRLLKHMDATGSTRFVVHAGAADRSSESMLSTLTAGYVQRGDALLPRQGTHGVWQVRNNYLKDRGMLRRGRIDDGILRFDRGAPAAGASAAASRASA